MKQFDILGAMLITLVCVGSIPAPGADLAPAHTTQRERVKAVADAVLRDFLNPPPFDWGEGVLLTGMLRAHQLTQDGRYLQFVKRFGDHWAERGIGPTLAAKGYCGHWGPGFPMLMLHESTRQPRYLGLAEQVIEFMQQRAERTKDGGLSHFNGKLQLWVDTLDMACPVFSHAARLKNQPAWQAEAVKQLEVFAKHLQDPETGLFYHMWDEASGQRTTNFWARGNGWVVLSCVEVLKNEKPDSAGRARVDAILRKQLASIMKLQDPMSGLWRTVLNVPDTYLETSASAMFLFGLAESQKFKLLDTRPYSDAMRQAWAGLATKVDDQGRVIGVSAGTGPTHQAKYAAIPVGSYTWGTGAFLLAACAYAESGIK